MRLHNGNMKYFILAIVIGCLVPSISFGKKISIRKVMVIQRDALIETEMAPLLLAKDQNNWRKVDQRLGENAKYENKFRNYKIESGKEEPNTGDLARYRFFVTKGTNKKEPLSSDPISGVEILAKGNFLLLEPLILINTTNWERVDLANAAEITPYFSIIRYSSKTNKILVAQFDCAYDCPKTDKTTIWEIGF